MAPVGIAAERMAGIRGRYTTKDDIVYITPYRYALQVYYTHRKLHTLSMPPLTHRHSEAENNIVNNKSTFKNIAKKHRQSASQLPPYLIPKQQYILAQHWDIPYDGVWKHIMKQLIKLHIDTITRDILLKLIHNSLYVGIVGRNHQGGVSAAMLFLLGTRWLDTRPSAEKGTLLF